MFCEGGGNGNFERPVPHGPGGASHRGPRRGRLLREPAVGDSVAPDPPHPVPAGQAGFIPESALLLHHEADGARPQGGAPHPSARVRYLPRMDHGVHPFPRGGEADRGEDDRGAAGAPPGNGVAPPQGGVRTVGSPLSPGRREPVASGNRLGASRRRHRADGIFLGGSRGRAVGVRRSIVHRTRFSAGEDGHPAAGGGLEAVPPRPPYRTIRSGSCT